MPQPQGSKPSGALRMTADEAREYFARRRPGDYTLLDVRQDQEYREYHLPGARLLPLPELPDRLDEIDRNLPVVAYCRSGRRSAAATGILQGQGFAVIDLLGGIEAWTGQVASGDRDTGMIAFPEAPTPARILGMAYAMEDGLGLRYRQLAVQAGDPEVAATLERLAGFEDKHKVLVMTLFDRLGPDAGDVRTLARGFPPITESGRPLDDYLDDETTTLSTPAGVLDLAMQIEAQALDLYMRYAQSAGPEAQDTFLRLAQEEKGHLKALGTLLDRK